MNRTTTRLGSLGLLASLCAARVVGGVLHSADFNAANDWPAFAAFPAAGSGVSVSAARAAVGTVDDAAGSASGAVVLRLEAAPAAAAWRAGVSSGRLALANREADLAKLTVGFDLWTSLVQPVRVRVQSFASAIAAAPTGTLEAVVVPPVAGSFFRHTVDLSAFAAPAAGAGSFDPLAPFVELQFEIDSADGWVAATGDALRVDNVSYTSPALYVSSRTGSNANDGRTEARPLATIQRAVDLAQPGDVILVMEGTYTANVTWPVTLFKSGTPARWIVLRGHPAGARPQVVSGPATWAAIKMDHTSAYLELRGFVVRGLRPQISLAAAEANYDAAVSPAFNGNGIDADGRQGSGTRRPHHLRIIGNEVFDHCGGGISVIAGDHVTVEGNTVYNNCWYMRYAGSGISYLTPTDVDGSTGTTNLRTKLFILGNTVYRNQCFVRWKNTDRFSDGNGIIVDTTKDTNYAGRTLVQNNVAFGNGGSGIHAFDSDHVDILHNTAYYNGQSPALRWGEIFANRCADVNIANNILWAAPGRPINSVGNSNPSANRNVTYTHNLYFGDGGNFVIPGTGDLRANPQFALLPALAATSPTPADNALVGPFDFRLRASSPAIDTAAPGGPRRDAAGVARPQGAAPDRGAFERTGAPIVLLPPRDTTVAPGDALALGVEVADPDARYTWLRDGVVLPGETQARLVRAAAAASDAGSYVARITATDGQTVATAPARVALDPDAARLVNVSCRVSLAAGRALIPGFFVAGTGTKSVLIRAVGPGLTPLGVGGALADPQLRVFRGETVVATNDDWDAARIGDAFARVGAFALPPGSRDAVALLRLEAQAAYTVHVTGPSGGVVLFELYDADAPAARTARLLNVSVRGATGTGDDTLILGCVLAGAGDRSLLVRGAGPALAAFGVAGALADPRLAVFDGAGRLRETNDDWGTQPFPAAFAHARESAGAFAFAAGSRDAATLARFPSGAYTVHVAGSAATATGEALAELYSTP